MSSLILPEPWFRELTREPRFREDPVWHVHLIRDPVTVIVLGVRGQGVILVNREILSSGDLVIEYERVMLGELGALPGFEKTTDRARG